MVVAATSVCSCSRSGEGDDDDSDDGEEEKGEKCALYRAGVGEDRGMNSSARGDNWNLISLLLSLLGESRRSP